MDAEPITMLERHKQDMHGGFEARPRYYEQGDYLTYFIKDKRCFAQRVSPLVTVYTAVDDDEELVGCKVKGVQRLIQQGKSFGVIVSDGEVTLGILFLQLALEASNVKQRDELVRLAKQLGNTTVPRQELSTAV